MALKRINKVCEKNNEMKFYKSILVSMNLLCANVFLVSLKTVKKFLVTKKKFMQEMWNVGTTTAMYKEKKRTKKKRNEPNMWAKENVQKAKKQMKNGRWRRALITTKS